MAAKVLDSYALMAFFEDEPGADFVRGLIQKAVESDSIVVFLVKEGKTSIHSKGLLLGE